MKKAKIIFWVTTVIIVLFEGVMPLFTGNSEMAKEGIRSLGYPEYFGMMLIVFKVLGSIALIVPQIPARVKEWAYAGFMIDFLSALISLWVVTGFGVTLLLPVVCIAILIASYLSYHKIRSLEGKTI